MADYKNLNKMMGDSQDEDDSPSPYLSAKDNPNLPSVESQALEHPLISPEDVIGGVAANGLMAMGKAAGPTLEAAAPAIKQFGQDAVKPLMNEVGAIKNPFVKITSVMGEPASVGSKQTVDDLIAQQAAKKSGTQGGMQDLLQRIDNEAPDTGYFVDKAKNSKVVSDLTSDMAEDKLANQTDVSKALNKRLSDEWKVDRDKAYKAAKLAAIKSRM